MKKLIIMAVVIITATSAAAEWQGNINGSFGKKKTSESIMEDLDIDNQSEYGLMLDVGGKTWPVNIAVGVSTAGDNNSGAYTTSYYTSTFPYVNYVNHYVEIDLDSYSIFLGIKKEFTPEVMDIFHFYLSGGAMALYYEVEFKETAGSGPAEIRSGDDWCYGGWAETGFYFTLAQNFNLGASLRLTKAENDNDVDFGGKSLNILCGYRF